MEKLMTKKTYSPNTSILHICYVIRRKQPGLAHNLNKKCLSKSKIY
jgi:hypothetical protein